MVLLASPVNVLGLMSRKMDFINNGTWLLHCSDAVIRGRVAILSYYKNIEDFHLSSDIIAKLRAIM